jgi:branched-chain amino acid transport system substrate-binding protein
MKDTDVPFFRVLVGAVFVIALATVFGPGCAKKQDTIKIGAVFSVTGSASFLGDPEKKTVDMLADELNKNGGINGKKVMVIVEDDKGDESTTIKEASKLIDKDQVLAIIGPSRSGNTKAVMQLAADKKVPLVSCALAEGIVNPVNEWVFKTPQRDSHVAEQVLKEINRQGIKEIAVLYENTGFGQEGLAHIEDLCGKYNVKVAFKEGFTPTATDNDIVTVLTKIKANPKIKAIVNWSVVPAQSVIPKKMQELDMKKDVALFASQGFGNIKYVQNAGAAADGVIFPAGKLLVADELKDSDPQKKVITEYKKSYETRYKEDSSVFGAHAYDAFWIVVNAIKTAGTTDREKIREAIENTSNFIGADGVYNFTRADHNGLTMDSLELLTVKDGKFTFFNQGGR